MPLSDAEIKKFGIQAAQAAIAERNEQVTAHFDAVDAKAEETGSDPVLTASEREEVKTLNKEIEAIEHHLKDLMEAEGIRVAAQKRREEFNAAGRLPLNTPDKNDRGDRRSDRYREAQAVKSRGQRLIEDPAFKAWMKQMSPSGQIMNGARLHSPAMQITGEDARLGFMGALITGGSTTSGGALIPPDFRGLMDSGAYMRPLTLVQLITTLETSIDAVSYVRENVMTINAATVAEATATDDGTGQKPESAMSWEQVTDSIKTIAHWIPMTRQALSDVTQIRSYVDQFLEYGLNQELEDQVAAGDGTGENFEGILNVSGTQSQAFTADILTTTRKARTKCRIGGRVTPTAYVMHPNDWETIDLLQDNEKRYYYGGPTVIGNPRLWGLPVVECEAFTEGTSMVADWSKAVLWNRMLLNILISDSHADFFTRNLVAVLAEMRAGFGVLRPAAFVEIDMTA